MKKTLVLIVANFDKNALGKDAFLVPYYWGKLHKMDVSIVFPATPNNRDLPLEYRGVKLCPVKFKTNDKCFSWYGEWYFIYYIIRNAFKIDVLMRFHFSFQSFLIGSIYKLLNRNGFFYLKGDGYGIISALIRKKLNVVQRLNNVCIRYAVNKILSISDLVSVEPSDILYILKNNKYGIKLNTHLIQLYNGFDEELLESYSMHIRDFSEKENLFITVGRLGTYQKNTEYLLSAIEKIEIKDWKFILVGTIEEKECDFSSYIEEFYKKHPHLIDKVIFTGPIMNKKELWDLYNRSKVFVLTSRSEGYALVYLEAVRFNNYIITTDVGGGRDSISLGHGEIISHDDEVGLSVLLQTIINGEKNISHFYKNNNDKKYISWEYLVQKLDIKNEK